MNLLNFFYSMGHDQILIILIGNLKIFLKFIGKIGKI